MADKNLKVNLIANTSKFKSAMSESNSQIKLLNSEFKNAAAETDKYGNKIDSTGAKQKQLSGLVEQHRLRIKAIKDEQRHWTNELKKGNITEEQHAQKQQELARRLNNTEAQMKSYEGQLKRLNAEGKATTRTYADFDRQFRDVGRSMRNIGAQVGITAGVGFMAMKRVLGDVVGEAKDFQFQMSEVKAISGATGAEMEKLTQQSKDLGKATKFTAQQAAESQAELARAGFSTAEIYDTMPGLLDLAASSNLDLGQSAKITSNIIRGFNKEAKESAHIADVLAKGAATANTDVAGLGQAMEVAAPVAQSLSIEFESVAAAAGIMADAGIDGSKSGRMLRQGMLRLSKPTGQAAKLLKDLGINAFDADGNMKSLDGVVAELEKGLEGQSKQAKAAALATIFGSESTAGWTVLLEKGSGALAEYTKELENSDGAAKDMADTMMDNAEGAIIKMQSALSGMKIELGEKLLPILSESADKVSDLANRFSDMDDSTVQTIAQAALLVTAVLGVTTAVGGLAAGIGALMAFAGPVGLTLTGGTLLFGGLAAAIYKNNLEAEQAKEVNLDLTQSLHDQASELEKNVDTFDRLSGKAKISNDELALLYDLNQRIAQGGSSDEIAKLQQQYDKLAEKSGLSKEELKKLFGANESIIEQSPNVEKSISDQGTAFVENTDAVKEYIQSLYEASEVELKGQREKQLQRHEELTDEITKKQRQLNDEIEKLNVLDELRSMSQEEILDLQGNIVDKMNETKQGSDEWLGLNKQLEATMDAQVGKADEQYLKQVDIVQEKRDSVNASQEELEKIEAISGQLADVKLKQAGINEEGEKGRVTLEETLVKNDEQLAKLDAQLEKNGQLTSKEQEKYDKLVEQNSQLQSAQDYINNELEMYGSVNSLVESKLELLSESTQKRLEELEATHDIEVAEGNIINQLQEKQQKLVEERDQLEENRQKQGANKEEIDKQIAAIDEKINKGDDVILSILSELDVLELVKDGIKLNSAELEKFLVGLGYTKDEAAALAKTLVGDTIAEMDAGAVKAEEAGKQTGKGHADGIASTKSQNKNTTNDIVDNVIKEFGLGKSDAETHGKSKGDAHDRGLKSTRGNNVNTSINIVDNVLKELGIGKQSAESSGKEKGTAHKSGLESTQGANESASNTLSSAVTKILGSTTDGKGGSTAGTLFVSGLLGQRGNASGAGVTISNTAKSALASVSTKKTGTDFISGFIGSIRNSKGSVWSAAWSIGRHALSALKGAIDSHSPSKETEKEGINFTDGFSNAIKKGSKGVADNVNQLSTLALKELANIAKEQSKATNIATVRLADRLKKVTADTNKEIASINKKANAEAKKLEKRSQEDINSIHRKAKAAKRKLTKDESIRIRRIEEDTAKKVKAVHVKASKDIQKIEKDKSKKMDEVRADEFRKSVEWIEYKKEHQQASLMEELADWERVQARYKKGTKEREEAEKNVLRVKTEIHDKLMNLNDEYLSKMQAVNDEYEQAVTQRFESIKNTFGLFDEIGQKDYVSGSTLIDNLQGQVNELESWSSNLKILAQRGIDDGLLKELQDMGPRAANEIVALVEMSDEELTEFQTLWTEKTRLAKEQALYELEELREVSEEKLEQLQSEWISKVEEIRYGTKNEFGKMPGDLNLIGNQAIEGMIVGMENMRGPLMAKARSLANAVRATIQAALDINSPSGVMERDVGHHIPSGIAVGIEGNISVVKRAMQKMNAEFKAQTATFKNDFGKLAFSLDDNKQTLKIEQEVKHSGLESKLDKLIELLMARENNNQRPEIKQEINIHSPDPTSPSQNARKIKQVSRQLAMEWR